MLTVDIKSLLSRLNNHCTRALEGAAGMCISRTHYEVTVEHMLLRLLEENQGDVPCLLAHFGIEPAIVQRGVEQALEQMQFGNTGKPVFSPLLVQWFQDAWLISSIELEENRVRSGALLGALLAGPRQLTEGSYVELLRGIGREALMAGFSVAAAGSSEQAPAGEQGKQKENLRDGGALARFCVDFTRKARDGEIDPVFGRDREISQMIDILARRRKNNPIVVGEAGVGKTAVVEGLALRIVELDVPEFLRDVTILGLDMGLLQAGAGVKGEFENRLKSVISEVRSSPRPIILFVDEAHTLIGAGGQAGGSDASNLLKPALARGELRTIAATTWSEYKKYFERDAALARRFQPVKLEEPSVETTTLILRGLKGRYEEAHGVAVRDDAVAAASELAGRYISGRQLPDKAVDLLDTSAARVKVLLTAKPAVIEERERTIHALEREKRALERDRIHGHGTDPQRRQLLDERLTDLRAELLTLSERWLRERELALRLVDLRRQLCATPADNGVEDRPALVEESASVADELERLQDGAPLVKAEVDPDVVARVVSDWTGIPLGRVLRDQRRTLTGIEADLRLRIRGQDEAVGCISRAVRSAKAGLIDSRGPQGVFLLVGPSGVGKTETALAVADLMFGGERFLTTINMSEFQEAHTVSRLIGSPPGYVGFGEGGVLTEAVRRRPYSVVLMNEVEKADPDVLNLFYQVFDKGVLADGEGREIDFRNTILFLTSNLASDIIAHLCTSTGRPAPETVIEAIRPVLSRHFKPALLARMTIVPYYLLDPSAMEGIVRIRLERLSRLLSDNSGMRLRYSPGVAKQIAARCNEVDTGARNVDHILNGTIIPLLSGEILARMDQDTLPPTVRLVMARDGGIRVAFRNESNKMTPP